MVIRTTLSGFRDYAGKISICRFGNLWWYYRRFKKWRKQQNQWKGKSKKNWKKRRQKKPVKSVI